MKNIEGISKEENKKLGKKVKNIINETNNLLNLNLEDRNTIKEIRKIFRKTIKIAKIKIKKVNNIKDFEEFLSYIEKFLKELDIEKIYNSTTTFKIKEFDKLELFSKFFYISTPINNSNNFSFIKGGVCYHWAIFFYDFFEKIDKEGKIKKHFLTFDPKFNHGVLLIEFQKQKYIIDPYSKKKGLINKIKKGSKIYLGESFGNIIFGNLENEKKLKISLGEYIFKAKINNKKEFIEKAENTKQLINIKTYLNGKSIHLIVKDLDDEILIILNGILFKRDKEFAIMDIMSLYLEKKKISKSSILLNFLGLQESEDNIKNNIKILSEKLNIDFLFEKLGIQEDINMFYK